MFLVILLIDPLLQGPFLEHLGIITSDINYVSTEGSYWGVYHSNYDDFRWVDKFGDPGNTLSPLLIFSFPQLIPLHFTGFQYVRSVTQFIGVSAMRLASLTVLNFNYQDYPAIMRQSIVCPLSPLFLVSLPCLTLFHRKFLKKKPQI